MTKLTPVEEEIMRIIWKLERCLVRDIIDYLEQHTDREKIPHSSISSIVRLLEKKGYVGHKAYGRTYEYFPLKSKKAYSKNRLSRLVNDYFDGSMNRLVSFMVKENDLNINELSELIEKLDEGED